MAAVGDRYRYKGPWDPCAEFGPHPYSGRVGTVVAVVTTLPLPERPITLRFSDGETETTMILELDPA